MRSIFDDGGMGMVLIGMPGIELRVARVPQFYSRIGFVHELRPLDEAQITKLLNERWLPAGVRLPDAVFAPDMIATLIRMRWELPAADAPPPLSYIHVMSYENVMRCI